MIAAAGSPASRRAPASPCRGKADRRSAGGWAAPVGMVFAARQPGEALRHLAELEVKGLVDGDARTLLGSAVGFVVDEGVRDRLVAEAGGSPLALLPVPPGL